MLKGIRTIIYGVNDLNLAKEWYANVIGAPPYYDTPFYIGFNVSGYELGLISQKSLSGKSNGVVAYWGVEDIEAASNRLLSLGATVHEEIQDVGDGIKVSTFFDPFGNIFGIIYNPHFLAQE